MSDFSTRLRAVAHQAVVDKVAPGVVIGVILPNGERSIVVVGSETYSVDAPAIREEAVFDLASVTKVFPTGLLGAMLLDEDKLSLDTPVISLVPELSMSDANKILARHLFTYTVCSPAFGDNKHAGYEQLHQAIFSTSLGAPVGERFLYTNLPSYLLGLCIERLYGKRLDQVFQEKIADPLALQSTTFAPLELPAGTQVVPSELNHQTGVVHDESAACLQACGEIPGHAGLFSTAGDLLTIMEMLLGDGCLLGQRLLSTKGVDTIFSNHTPHLEQAVGLSWVLNAPSLLGEACTLQTAGKTGFTGTLVAIDRSLDVAWVILSNRTYPVRGGADGITSLRQAIGTMVLQEARRIRA